MVKRKFRKGYVHCRQDTFMHSSEMMRVSSDQFAETVNAIEPESPNRAILIKGTKSVPKTWQSFILAAHRWLSSWLSTGLPCGRS